MPNSLILCEDLSLLIKNGDYMIKLEKKKEHIDKGSYKLPDLISNELVDLFRRRFHN